MSRSWYVFIGSDPTETNNYHKISVKHNCLCGEEICVIYAGGIDINPISPLSPNIKLYIKNALATGKLQPSAPYNAKKYVYLK